MKRTICFISALLALAAARDPRSDLVSLIHSWTDDLEIGQFNANETCKPETMKEVKECLKSYYSSYGFDIREMPSEQKFEDILSASISYLGFEDGIKYECKKVNTLKTCLANIKEAASCQNVQSYMSLLGLDAKEAANYLQSNVGREYACDNEPAYIHNYECTSKMIFDKSNLTAVLELVACGGLYSLEYFFTHDLCPAFSHFIDCVGAVLSDGCGKQIESFSCNIFEKTFNVVDPQCQGKLPACNSPVSLYKKKHPHVLPGRISSLRNPFPGNFY